MKKTFRTFAWLEGQKGNIPKSIQFPPTNDVYLEFIGTDESEVVTVFTESAPNEKDGKPLMYYKYKLMDVQTKEPYQFTHMPNYAGDDNPLVMQVTNAYVDIQGVCRHSLPMGMELIHAHDPVVLRDIEICLSQPLEEYLKNEENS